MSVNLTDDELFVGDEPDNCPLRFVNSSAVHAYTPQHPNESIFWGANPAEPTGASFILLGRLEKTRDVGHICWGGRG